MNKDKIVEPEVKEENFEEVPAEPEEKAKDGGTWLKCKSGYYVNKKYMEFVRYV